MTIALLLIDIQNDYFPGGKMELAGVLEAAEETARLLRAFRAAQRNVIHIQHISTRPDAPFFLPNTKDVELHTLVKPLPGEPTFIKAFPNSFRETGLLEYLRKNKIESLTVAGMMTQRCVDTTVRAAFDLKFNILLAHDACATRDQSFGGVSVPAKHVQAAFMAALSMGFARVVTAEDACLSLRPSDAS
jgi:nicotinamidase-related amidase